MATKSAKSRITINNRKSYATLGGLLAWVGGSEFVPDSIVNIPEPSAGAVGALLALALIFMRHTLGKIQDELT